ncbi:MAG: hypothetical protein KIS92_03450 [Planctomycetota bacterium]|nr:hypothetical protein [Planctomycetota bacterium]
MNGRAKMLSAFVAAAAFVTLASTLMPGINAQREALNLTVDPKVMENLPPEIAFTQAALGSFRGLAVDYLWIRLQQLKDQGKHYEAMELSRWITKLQPRFVSVWDFHAWNMAYNVSEAVRTPEEKWRWVQAGIRLLRDEGIPLNASSPKLYEVLAWIYFHKIGKYSTFAQDYYKLRHAMEWHELLGAMPKGSAQAAVDWFRPIAEAPPSFEQLLAKYPDLARQAEALKEMNLKPDRELLYQIVFLQADAGMADAEGNLVGAVEGSKLTPEGAKLMAWMKEPAIAEERAALLAFVRARILREEYHMDPAFMLELHQSLGPIDWRHPAAHTVYWSLLGARKTAERPGVDLYDLMSADRMVVSGLKDLVFGGSVSFDPITNYYSLIPEPLLLDAYEKAYMEAQQRLNKGAQYEGALRENYRGFLMQAVSMAYFYGSQEMAQRYYAKLREEFGHKGDYTRPIESFVMSELLKGNERLETVKPAIQGFLYRAFEQGYSAGRGDLAKRFLTFAKQLYDHFQELQRNAGVSFVKQDLPPFPAVVADAARQYLLDAALPHRVRARVWRMLPLDLRQTIFDTIQGPLYEDARRKSVNPELAYPEPEGLEEIRKKRALPLKPEAQP